MADDTYSRGYRGHRLDRGGAEASRPANDPLSELARLIGQTDPFAIDPDRRPAPRPIEPTLPRAGWRDHRETASYESDDRYGAESHDAARPPEQYPDADERHDAGGYAASDDESAESYADERAGYGEARGYAEDPRSDYGHGDQADAYDDQSFDEKSRAYEGAHHGASRDFGPDELYDQPDEYYEDDVRPQRRAWPATVGALLGLAVIGTAGAFAYRAVFSGGTPPFIMRDGGPNKVVATATNTDSATTKQLDRLAPGAPNERLAPPPEQPLNIPEPARNLPAGPGIGQFTGATPAVTPGGAASQPMFPSDAPATAPAAAQSEPATPAPRRIRTVTIKSDQGAPEAGAARPPANQRVVTAPQSGSPRAAAPAANTANNAPLSLSPQEAPAVAPPALARTTAVAPPPPAETATGSGYFVQVSAQKSEDEAKSSFQSIQSRYANLLGNHTPVFRRKDLGSKGVFFGAQVGPFSREDAVHLCERLKSAGGSCMVQKN